MENWRENVRPRGEHGFHGPIKAKLMFKMNCVLKKILLLLICLINVGLFNVCLPCVM